MAMDWFFAGFGTASAVWAILWRRKVDRALNEGFDAGWAANDRRRANDGGR